jgi:hypothetical protein
MTQAKKHFVPSIFLGSSPLKNAQVGSFVSFLCVETAGQRARGAALGGE